jgi:Tocopherol cyclase
MLQTPHDGYHWQGHERDFFEGWYLRITLPKIGESFAFMYSIEDPLGINPHRASAAQILGIGEKYIWTTFAEPGKFWADRSCWSLGHWGETNSDDRTRLSSYRDCTSRISARTQLSLVLSNRPRLWLGTAAAASTSHRRGIIISTDL